jgi:hypothetical protein
MYEPLLEREHDQAAIDRLVEGAQQRSGGAPAIAGPPGIGKTALLAGACAVARARGLTVPRILGGLRLGCLPVHRATLRRQIPNRFPKGQRGGRTRSPRCR